MEVQKTEEARIVCCKICSKDPCVCEKDAEVLEKNADQVLEDIAERFAEGGSAISNDQTQSVDVDDETAKLNLADSSRVVERSDSELAPFDPWIGRTIKEQYEIVSLIARGGMGAVYRARHVLLGTSRAIKVIRPDVHRDSQVYQRFKQEAQAFEALSHPNIIGFYDYGVFEYAPYVVMDLLEGQSLDAAIRREGTLLLDEALNIFVQVSAGLDHAHSKGVLHRDIKPSNIMLVHDELGKVVPKILDFGIAKIKNATEEQKLTGTGEIFGSPAYMSPEQGKGQEVDARSDVYSLGCVMYESIVGEPPFEGRNAIETIMLHLNSPVARLPKPAKGTNPVVYHDLENIIMRCLEKDPKDRYASMAQLNDDLKSLSYGERLLQLQREKSQKSRLQLFDKIYKFGLIGFAISIIPYAVFAVYLDPNSWRKELAEALEDQDNADKVIQQIIRDLNPKEDMYNWNKAYLLWNQAQIYRMKSASNPNLLAFAEEKYQQAKVAVDQFSREKGGYPRLIRSMKAMCNQGLVRCHLDAFSKIHAPATLKKLIAQAKSLYKSGELDSKDAKDNELVQALNDATSAVSLRRETLQAKGDNKNDGVLLAQALELMAQALAPLGEYKRIDEILSEQERIVSQYAPASWMEVDCLLNRAEILRLLGRKSEAMEKLVKAREFELDLYRSQSDPYVLNIQNRIDALQKELTQLRFDNANSQNTSADF